MEMEKVILIEEAQALIYQALELLDRALKDDANAQAYVLDHLKILAGSGHGFLSRDLNLDDLIARYMGNEE